MAEYNAWKGRHVAKAAGAVAPYSDTKWAFVARVLEARGLHLEADAQRLIEPGS